MRQPHRLSAGRSNQGVGLPRKYLGHGICDARSKLLNLRRATADAGTLKSHALQLLREAKVPPDKIRGIGLQMTRLGPSTGGVGGVGGGDGVGVGADGGSFGALHGWLIKPGGEEGAGDSLTNSAASTTPTEPGRATAVGEHGSPSSVRKGKTEGDAAPPLPSSLSPNAVKGRGGSLGSSSRSLQPQAVNGDVGVGPKESAGDEMAVSRQQEMALLDAAAGTAAASPRAHRGNKRPRGGGGEQDAEAAPSNARPSPRRRSDPQSIVSFASTTLTSAAGVGVGAGPATVDEAVAGAARERSAVGVPGSARKRKVAWTDHLDKEEPAVHVPSSTSSAGGGATPSRKTEREHEAFGGAVSSREGAGSGPSFSPAARRPTNHATPDSPEFLSPPTPAERVMATPSTGTAASPSMSQVRE